MIRVWSPGCATGEEAYSLAILLAEHQEALKSRFRIQVIATDIDSQAVATAGAGIYPASIAADVSPERLARFFSTEPDGSSFRIHKRVRDLLVFSEHDVVKDQPFPRLDLICCRNLLTCLTEELQKKLICLLHYALNPGGFLFLGASETVGEFGNLFATQNRKFKIFQRKQALQPIRHAGLKEFQPPLSAPEAPLRESVAPDKLSLRELTEQALLQQVVPTAALVRGNGDILYLHGRTGLYLEPAPGEAGVNNILEMAREGLRRELASALQRAAEGQEIVRFTNLPLRTNGEVIAANLSVSPVEAGLAGSRDTPLYLVVFEQVPHTGKEEEKTHAHVLAGCFPGAPGTANSSRIAALEKQLRTLEHRVIRLDRNPGGTVSRAAPKLGEALEIVEWLGTARDVAARSKAEEMRVRERTHCT